MSVRSPPRIKDSWEVRTRRPMDVVLLKSLVSNEETSPEKLNGLTEAQVTPGAILRRNKITVSEFGPSWKHGEAKGYFGSSVSFVR